MNPLISDQYEDDKSDRTRIVSDRILPGIRSKGYGLAGAATGAMIGAGMGLAGRKAMSAGMKKMLSSDTTQLIKKTLGENLAKGHEGYVRNKKLQRFVDKPARIIMGPEMAKVRTMAAAGTGALAMAPKGKTLGKVLGNTSELRKNYVSQYGVEPTEHELLEVSKLNPGKKFDRSLLDFFYTPESMTKSTFRNTRQMMNPPEAILKNREAKQTFNQSPIIFNPFLMPKLAEEENEKLASLKDITKTVNTGIEATKKVINKADKISPLAGGLVGASSMLLPSYAMSGTVVDADDDKKKLKRKAFTAGGALLGGVVGSTYLKNGTGLIKGVADKVSDPTNTMINGVKNYMDLVKNADYYANEIEKTAKNAYNEFVNQINTANAQRGMTQEQFNEFAKKMNEVYGANTEYVNNPDPNKSYAIMNENIKGIHPSVLEALGVPKNIGDKNFVQSIPLEEVLLHETGHILDKDLKKTQKKADKLNNYSHMSGIAGFGAGSLINNAYASAAAHGAGTLGAAYLKNRSGKAIEKREDDANAFAKSYMLQKHNGNQALADEEFKNSTLGAARKTYTAATKAGTIGRGMMYGLPGAYDVYKKVKGF